MTNRNYRFTALGVLTLAALLSGCTSAKEVRDLTLETNKNISKVSKALTKFEKKSTALQKELAAKIDAINRDTAINETAMEKNLLVWQLAGAKHKEKFLAKTRLFADAVGRAELLKTAENAKQRRKEILDTLDASKAPSADMKALQEKIAKLLKSDDSFKSRLKSFLNYSKEVAKEIKKAEEAKKKAEKAKKKATP